MLRVPFVWFSLGFLSLPLRAGQTVPPLVLRSHAFDSPRVHDRLWLDVSLPASYEAATARRYPVVYLTDGYWRRTDHAAIHALSAAGKLPEVIVVGVGYPNHSAFDAKRERDLLIHPDIFLAALRFEVIPIIEREYRADPAHRTLWGASFGGSFLLHALAAHRTSGDLFENYLFASPVLRPEASHHNLRKELADALTAGADRPLGVYLAVGGEETDQFLADYDEVSRTITRHGGREVTFTHRVIRHCDHFSVATPALLDALQTVLRTRQDPAPSSASGSEPAGIRRRG